MKITQTAVYKLAAQAECGCTSTAEYHDAKYHKPVGEIAFAPCATHKDTDFTAALATILKEVVVKEATDRQGPLWVQPAAGGPVPEGVEVRHPLPAVARVARVSSAAARSETGPTGRPTLRAVASGATAPPIPLGTAVAAKAGTETRTPLPGPRPTPGGTPRVSGGAPGIKRVDPNAALVHRGLATAKTAAAAAPMTLDIGDEVDEDTRLTNLLETSGALETDEFDED
jgi:hypothetical protein